MRLYTIEWSFRFLYFYPVMNFSCMRNLLFLILGISVTTICDGQRTVGLIANQPGCESGYILFAPSFGDTTYLIDKCGYRIHQWASNYTPGLSAYLLDDGSLLRTGRIIGPGFNAGGKGGIIERFDWNGQLMWSYLLCDSTQCQHHDLRPLPNGNILVLAWELKSQAEVLSAGRDTSTFSNNLWSEKVVELEPVGTNGANIVWEWHVWDHLMQSLDSSRSGYTVLNQHPELININYPPLQSGTSDWLHCNSLDYNPALDQIIISSHNNCEFWIIDHSTTTTEAASHSGGRYGRGGDLLYRWGNPEAYDRGTVADRKLFGQHYPHWIVTGTQDTGSIMVFNNGPGRPSGNISSVDIIASAVDASGNYTVPSSGPFAPDSAYWTYMAPTPTDFFALNISGATRLSNGNMLICSGPQGLFFEIDTLKNTVWQYINPVSQGSVVLSQGDAPTMNSVFRCTEYLPGFAGFTGKTLSTGDPVELNPGTYLCSMTPGIGEPDGPDKLLSLSNSTNGDVTLSWTGQPDHFTAILLTPGGQCVAEYKSIELKTGETFRLPLSTSLVPGIYLLKVTNGAREWNLRFFR